MAQPPIDLASLLEPLRDVGQLPWLALFVGLIALWLVRGLRRRSSWQTRSGRGEALPEEFRFLRPKRLLSKTELSFFVQLRAALPEYDIFPQVAFRAVVQIPSGLNPRLFGGLARALGARHADFLVCARSDCRILAFIELDDPSHDRPLQQQDDRNRDRMLAAAGYRCIRFHTRHWPDRQAIRIAFNLAD